MITTNKPDPPCGCGCGAVGLPRQARPPPQRWRQAAEHREAPRGVTPPQPDTTWWWRDSGGGSVVEKGKGVVAVGGCEIGAEEAELVKESFKKAKTKLLVEESSKKAKAEIAQESSSKRAGEELEQETSKKQKVE
ncbi:hypothetical protein Tco_1508184 [Tanacetum coccineum]